MATGYEKINAIKNKLKVKQTVNDLARLMNCGPRTIFRHLEVIGEENCGLRKFKENGETYYIIQTEKEANFNQEVVKQLEKIKKSLPANAAPDIKTVKLLDKVIKTMQTTNPEDFKPEAAQGHSRRFFHQDPLPPLRQGPYGRRRGDPGSEPGQGNYARRHALPGGW